MTGDSAGADVLTGGILSFDGRPGEDAGAVVHVEDGAVAVRDGRISWAGERSALPADVAAGAVRHDYGGHLIMPGFVDAHVHYPQVGVIASHGAQLLDWLERFTFPEEARFSDIGHARRQARLFLDLLLANGTTTAAVFCTAHPESADAFFEEAARRDLRMIAGKVLMDRNAPAGVRDTARGGHDDSAALIRRWHGKGRGLYAVTPRFAPTSTPEQLEACGALLAGSPGVYLQTHLSENRDEVAWVAELFPEASSYLDVYDRFGLLGPRSLFGHAIHLGEDELARVAESRSKLVHCPTSNLFIGSGLFDLARARRAGIDVLLASDVGGGTSLSPFATMKAAYEIAQLNGHSLSPEEAFWMATAGAAEALSLGGRIGRIAPGHEADLVVVDVRSTPMIAQRTARAESLSDVLFAQIVLADDRAIRAAWAGGRLAHDRGGATEERSSAPGRRGAGDAGRTPR